MVCVYLWTPEKFICPHLYNSRHYQFVLTWPVTGRKDILLLFFFLSFNYLWAWTYFYIYELFIHNICYSLSNILSLFHFKTIVGYKTLKKLRKNCRSKLRVFCYFFCLFQQGFIMLTSSTLKSRSSASWVARNLTTHLAALIFLKRFLLKAYSRARPF